MVLSEPLGPFSPPPGGERRPEALGPRQGKRVLVVAIGDLSRSRVTGNTDVSVHASVDEVLSTGEPASRLRRARNPMSHETYGARRTLCPKCRARCGDRGHGQGTRCAPGSRCRWPWPCSGPRLQRIVRPDLRFGRPLAHPRSPDHPRPPTPSSPRSSPPPFPGRAQSENGTASARGMGHRRATATPLDEGGLDDGLARLVTRFHPVAEHPGMVGNEASPVRALVRRRIAANISAWLFLIG